MSISGMVGKNIGRYHVIEQLGQGGMAVVYTAFDTRLERDVAIKVIRTGMVQPDLLHQLLRRFEREAKSLAKMEHRAIVNIFDYGEFEGAPYLVMEYLPGGTLKEWGRRPMSYQKAARTLLPIGRALDYAHQQGIIHRDVKPSNILITRAGEPLLSDFGIAKVLEGEHTTQITSTGTGIGTPEYMAPEQWRNEIVPQTDIYALGIVFYEMVTGRKPYVADTPAAVAIMQATEPLPRPKDLAPGLPDMVENVLFKALAKQPEDRYATMGDFVAVLEKLAEAPMGESFKSEEETLIRPRVVETPPVANREVAADRRPVVPSAVQKHSQAATKPESPSGARRPWWVAWIAAAGAVGLLGLAGLAVLGGVALSNRYVPPEDFNTLDLLTDVGAYSQIYDLSAGDDDLVYFSSDIDGGQEVFLLDRDGNRTQLTNTPGSAVSGGAVAAANGVIYFHSDRTGAFEIYQLDSQGDLVQVTDSAGASSESPAPGPGGVLYFTSNRSGPYEIYMINTTGQTTRLTSTPGQASSWGPASGPDGVIYFASDRSGNSEIYQLSPDGNTIQITSTAEGGDSWGPSARDDGVLFFTSSRDGQVQIYAIDTSGETQMILTDLPTAYDAVVDGRNGIVFIGDIANRTVIYRLSKK